MKRLFIAVVCLALVVSAVFAADYSQKISQLRQEQKQRIDYIAKLQADYQKITQQYTNEIQAQQAEVLKIQGKIDMLTELAKADTQPKDE